MHWILVFFLIAFDHFCKQSTHMPPILKHGFFFVFNLFCFLHLMGFSIFRIYRWLFFSCFSICIPIIASEWKKKLTYSPFVPSASLTSSSSQVLVSFAIIATRFMFEKNSFFYGDFGDWFSYFAYVCPSFCMYDSKTQQ